jgi:hypothetical protein
MGSDDIAVCVSIELPLLMPAYPAETEFAFRNLAVMVAEKAMKNTLFIFFIEHGFFFHVPLPDLLRFVKTFFQKKSAIGLITMICRTAERYGCLLRSPFRPS